MKQRLAKRIPTSQGCGIACYELGSTSGPKGKHIKPAGMASLEKTHHQHLGAWEGGKSWTAVSPLPSAYRIGQWHKERKHFSQL